MSKREALLNLTVSSIVDNIRVLNNSNNSASLAIFQSQESNSAKNVSFKISTNV